jgi:excisionase family DNA binding protein
MTTEQAAEYLGVAPTTLRDWARAGTIPSHRLPGSSLYRYHPDELDAALGLDPEARTTRSPDFTRAPIGVAG